jgi:hypothetical protein
LPDATNAEPAEYASTTAIDYVRQVVALSSAAIVLSATLLGTAPKAPAYATPVLWGAWVFLVLALARGLQTYEYFIGAALDGEARPAALRHVARAARDLKCYFAAGLILLIAYAAVCSFPKHPEPAGGTCPHRMGVIVAAPEVHVRVSADRTVPDRTPDGPAG